jgi:tRNA pseudouridine55 synthase
VPSGIILLDKPLGLSSNAALQKVRRAFGAARAGHVGTLDPLATGMLPICLDEATKVIADIDGGRKAYQFTVAFGERTTTGDAEGEVVERAPALALPDAATLESVLASFHGNQMQVPPMYSAIKRDGRPLYERARAGEVVERTPRAITLYELRGLAFSATHAEFECQCSRGTYIRVLAEDLARAFGTCGHVSRLHRTWVEPFRDMPMSSLEAVLERAGNASGTCVLPADRALAHLPKVTVGPGDVSRFRGGQAVPEVESVNRERIGTRVRVYGPDSTFLGLGEVQPTALIQPRRVVLGG